MIFETVTRAIKVLPFHFSLQIACQEAISSDSFDVAREGLLRLHTALVRQHESTAGDETEMELKASESMVLRSLIRCSMDGILSGEHSHATDCSKYGDISNYCELAADRLDKVGFDKFFQNKMVGTPPM